MTKNKQNKNTELQKENRLEKMYTTLQEVQDRWNISKNKRN